MISEWQESLGTTAMTTDHGVASIGKVVEIQPDSVPQPSLDTTQETDASTTVLHACSNTGNQLTASHLVEYRELSNSYWHRHE